MLAQADTALDVETGDMLIKVGLVFLQAKIINKKYFNAWHIRDPKMQLGRGPIKKYWVFWSPYVSLEQWVFDQFKSNLNHCFIIHLVI